MSRLAPYAKAVVGFLLAGLTALGVALTDGAVSAAEWVAVAVSALGTLGGVYAVPNGTPPIPADPGGPDLEDDPAVRGEHYDAGDQGTP